MEMDRLFILAGPKQEAAEDLDVVGACCTVSKSNTAVLTASKLKLLACAHHSRRNAASHGLCMNAGGRGE